MSEDEEILFSGRDLCTYLIEQGYSDFGTCRASSATTEKSCKIGESSPILKENVIKRNYDISWCNEATSVSLSHHDYQLILSILNSQLIFKEDIELIEPFLLNICVLKRKPSLYMYACAALSGLLLSAVSYKISKNNYIPVGITVVCMIFTSWQYYKEYMEYYENKHLTSHIQTLQKLCSNIHRLLRYLKETEIISTGKVAMSNIGAAMYIPIHEMKKENDMKDAQIHVWKTLPHLRSFLSDSLKEIINEFSFACDGIREISPSWLTGSGIISLKYALKSVDSIASCNQYISLTELQSLYEVYLVIQSEYLKCIALNIFSAVSGSSLAVKNNTKKEVVKIFNRVQSKVANNVFKIMIQYNIHQISSATSTTVPNKCLKSYCKNIRDMQVEVHNVFLLMLSVLLRVRSLEEYLENIGGDENNQIDLDIDLTTKLATLKDDLSSAVRCYNTIYHQSISQKKAATDSTIIKQATEPKPKATGIVVGTSDFNVNSPDEVFLALSGLNSEDHEISSNDWYMESRPNIPKNLFIELSNTLQSRKNDFIEREKIALERQGMKDIESKLSDSRSDTSERDVSKKQLHKRIMNRHREKYKNVLHTDSSDSSEIELDLSAVSKEVPFGSMEGCKKLRSVISSDTDSTSSETNDNSYDNNALEVNSSIANLVATKSQLWGKKSEECYSDG